MEDSLGANENYKKKFQPGKQKDIFCGEIRK